MTKKNKANKIFMAVLFVLIVGFAFVGCENGTTSGVNSSGLYDWQDPITGEIISYNDANGKVFGVPYSKKAEGWWEGIHYSNQYLVTIPYDKAVSILTPQFWYSIHCYYWKAWTELLELTDDPVIIEVVFGNSTRSHLRIMEGNLETCKGLLFYPNGTSW